jgi:hypothetical protein
MCSFLEKCFILGVVVKWFLMFLFAICLTYVLDILKICY